MSKSSNLVSLDKAVIRFNPKLKMKSIHINSIGDFRKSLKLFSQKMIETKTDEEGHKDLINDFLKDTFYKNKTGISPNKTNIDLAILSKNPPHNVEVLFEVKAPNNSADMIKKNDFNHKSLQETLLYYLDECREGRGDDFKRMIITNGFEWFIFDAKDFRDKLYTKKLAKEHNDFKNGKLQSTSTQYFYNHIAPKHITNDIPFIYFNINDYKKDIETTSEDFSNPLKALYRVLSPDFLLKEYSSKDSNSLNKNFYYELLHIIGLEEKKDSGKLVIQRAKIDGSLMENTISKLENKIDNLGDLKQFGENREEQVFSVALELCLTWINRLLFLKLLESQIVSFHKNNMKKGYDFLNPYRTGTDRIINDFDDLEKLFFSVLSKPYADRKNQDKIDFPNIPYLNSSLFEPTEIEKKTVEISSIYNDSISLWSKSVLANKEKTKELPLIDYLLRFLKAYDFETEGKNNPITKETTSLINASVLGKIFEKINGYKDGSFFTPSYITEYICREAIESAIIRKTNEVKGLKLKTIQDVKNKIQDGISIKEANEIVNSIKICDPAVGSGHFLVSALNEIIRVKSNLGILCYKNGDRAKNDWDIEIKDDELVIHNDEGKLFEYSPTSKRTKQLQETLFNEKQIVIENCLFGVDINKKSVDICRLRLWVELLKNTYYKDYDAEAEYNDLETLPNIDINIKCGNSLIHKIGIDKSVSQMKEYDIAKELKDYRRLVKEYVYVKSKDKKREIRETIEKIRSKLFDSVKDALFVETKEQKKINTEIKKLKSSRKKATTLKERDKIDLEITKLSQKEAELKLLGEDLDNPIFRNALEWRIEFPQVLDETGNFIGFDAIIGNPPYIQLQKNGGVLGELYEGRDYEVFAKTGDIYALFYELGIRLVRDLGEVSFIVSNKWLRAGYGKNLREYLLKYNPITLLDLGGEVFESATVDTNILSVQKAKNKRELKALTVKNNSKDLAKELKENGVVLTELSAESWFIGSAGEIALKKKIEQIGTPLKDWDVNIYRGILTGLNEAFIIDTETKNRLCEEDPKSAEIIKPILRGRDIKRYSYDWKDLWIIATFPAKNIDIENYSAVKNYLLDFGKDRLEQAGKKLSNGKKSRKKTGNKWFETQDQIGYYEEFEKEKIVWGNIAYNNSFVKLDKGVFVNAPSNLITSKTINLNYLIACLNSKIFNWEFKQKGIFLGKAFEWKKQYVEKVHLPKITKENTSIAKEISKLADKILSIKKQNPNTNTTDLESNIDSLVYELYKLDRKEIDIIEEK